MTLPRLACLLLVYFGFAGATAAQVAVRGTVADAATDQPLPFTNVALLSPGDSSLVTGGITADDGSFRMQTAPGQYLLRVGFVGYSDRYEPLTVGAEGQDVGTLRLRSDATRLDEVTIEGMAVLFETAVDRRIFDVTNSIVAEGGTARDILETLPSVQVDDDGGISLRGSSDVLIYVNGRPTNLGRDDNESILDQFPANSIAKIELITNPSARYDAAGTGGIINIVLKKEARRGFNGQANASVGTRNKYTTGINLNYRTGGWNFYTNYNYQYRELFQLGETQRINRRPGATPLLDQDFDTDFVSISHVLRSGADWQLSQQHRLGAYVALNQRGRDRERIYNQRFQSLAGQTDSNFVRLLREDQSSLNLEGGLTYDWELGEGHRLSASASYAREDQERRENFDQNSFGPSGELRPESQLVQIYGRPDASDLAQIQLDYLRPIGKKSALEGGLKTTIARYDRPQTFDELDLNTGTFVRNDTVTDRFFFDEDVYAAYGIFRSEWGKLSYQAGLRGELTLTESYQFNADCTFVNNYFNLFPSVFFSYEFSDQQSLQLNYARRISRPSLWQLAPLFNVQDLLNQRIGNPFLQPEFTDSYELSYLRQAKRLFITSTLYHRREQPIITRVFNLLDGDAALVSWVNANQRRSTGLELINQVGIGNRFDATLTGNLFYSEVLGDNLGEQFSNARLTWTLSLLANLRLPKVASLQMQGSYRGPIVLPQGEIAPIFVLGIGARRDFWDRKFTVSANVSDVFNTQVFRIETSDPGFEQTRLFNRETRIGTLTLTYRFGGYREPRSRTRERGDGGEGDDF